MSKGLEFIIRRDIFISHHGSVYNESRCVIGWKCEEVHYYSDNIIIYSVIIALIWPYLKTGFTNRAYYSEQGKWECGYYAPELLKKAPHLSEPSTYAIEPYVDTE